MHLFQLFFLFLSEVIYLSINDVLSSILLIILQEIFCNYRIFIFQFLTNTYYSSTEIGEFQTEIGKFQTEIGKFQTEIGEFPTEIGEFQTEIGEFQTENGKFPTEIGKISTFSFIL